MTRPVSIDGEITPEEWPEDAPSTFRIDRVEQCLPDRRAYWKGPLDLNLVGRVAVDSEALYLALSVTDDTAVHTGEPWWAGDSIELFLHVEPSGRDPSPAEHAEEARYSDADWQVFLMPSNPHLRWGVAYHGTAAKFDDGGLVGVQMATVRRGGGSYDLELKLPLANFPALAGPGQKRIGFDLAVNDVDRYVPAPPPQAGSIPDPATYFTWNGKFDLWRTPGNFGVLEIPARPRAAPPTSPPGEDGSGVLWVLGLVALALVVALVGPGSRRLARAGPRPKGALLALDVLLAGFLALSSSCQERRARDEARGRLEAAAEAAQGIAVEAADLGALDPRDPAARARTLLRVLQGESVPCLPPVAAHAFVPLAPMPGEPGANDADDAIPLVPGTPEDWFLPSPVTAQALKVRLGPGPDAATRRSWGGAQRLGVLHATTQDGPGEDLPIETNLGDGEGERTIRLRLAGPASVTRLRYLPEPDAPSAVLAGITAVGPGGGETPLALPGRTEDGVPVLTRPGVRPGGPGRFLGATIPPRSESQFPVPPLPGADRLWVVAAVERGFPLTRHGLEVAEIRVSYAVGEPTVQRVLNGDDVDEERLNQAIKHPADMRSRVAYRWTDEAGVPRHHDLIAVPVDYARRPVALHVRNLSAPAGDQGTGALTLVSVTLARHLTEVPGGRLAVAPDPSGTGDRLFLRQGAEGFRDVLVTPRGEAVRMSAPVGRDDRRAVLSLATPLPEAVAERARRTTTALLTCLAIAAFLGVLLVVDAAEAFHRLAPRLALGVLSAALLPLVTTIVLADRRNAARLEEEREARVRSWLTATRNAILGTERQGAQVGAQGLLQLVTSMPDRGDPTRIRDQVGVFRRSGIVGGTTAAVVVKGRDVGTVAVEPEAPGARIDGPAFLADRADAPGLYASPWDGLLLVATARSVGLDDWRKVILGLRVDEEFVDGRVASAVLDRDAEVAVLTRTGAVAGAAGPGGDALAASLSARFSSLVAGAGGRDAVLLNRVPTEAGPRLALVAPLASAESPDAPAAWLAVGVARTALDADLLSSRAELVALGLAAAVMVACVAATLARRIAGPVRDLVTVTESVRRGEFDVEGPTPGADEIGDLTVAFDQMRRDLKQRVGDLDFLRRAQEMVSEGLDLARTADAGLARFRERFGAESGLLLLSVSPTGPVTVRSEFGRPTSAADRPIDAQPGGWLARALASTEPVVVDDAAHDPCVAAEATAANRLLDDRNAFVAIPLRAGGEVQGLVVLAWSGAAAMPATDARALLTPLAGVVALALHNARLYRLAALDEATGLPGATSFESALRREVEAALAGGPPVAVLRVGLDGLERLTVRRGVEAGRALLRAAADALRSAVGGRVQAARLREDEFAVRALGVSRDEAATLAAAIRERVAAVELRAEEGADPLRTGVTVGVARCPEDARSLEFLLDAAGRALAAGRRDGGDRVVDVHRVDAGLVDVPPFEDGAIFRTERMVRVLETARRAARTDSTVLLTGETGVGKEVIADLIHRRSLRAERPFVKVNAAAFPESLLESELFGHERGAFTGAERRREGRFELADGGTLFLDEVGEMPLAAQVRLLRVLAEGQFTRLGGTKPVDVDVRVIAATNEDLEKAVAEGRFREDLYYRLNVLRIEIPPLRERREEIPSLVEHFLSDARRRLGRGPDGLSPQAMDVLYRHPWPGNVRELRNVVERAAVMCEGDLAGPEHLRLDPPRAAAPAAALAVAAPLDALNDRQRRLLDHLAVHGRCTNREFIEMTEASERTGLRDLQELMAKGLIVREGKRRGAVYRLP